MRIYHNIPALYAYNAVSSTNSALQKSIAKLSSGLRINSAADDAAGLAISEKMRAQVNGLDQAVSNSQDGISMIQTAEGALNETHSILQRMRELSVQAANDTLTSEDRSYIQLEIDELKEEVTRISTTTQFNKKKLLDGSAAVLWSADKLETKALIRGALRQVDQFGQKSAAEGNYKISISANPGQAEVQKSDIFKIKHENVIMDVSLNTNAGVTDVFVDNLPAGDYTVYENGSGLDGLILSVGLYNLSASNISFGTGAREVNASVLLEVTQVNTGAGSVTFRAVSNTLGTDGTTNTYINENFMLTTAGFTVADTSLGFTITAGSFSLGTVDNWDSAYDIGDKIVLEVRAAATGASVQVSAVQNPDWDYAWNTAAAAGDRGYNVSAAALRDKTVHFRSFYLNSANGTTYESDVAISFSTAFGVATATLASFEAAYIGQVAKGDVQLRDLDKFWDANGRFLLEDPQVVTITQGDGKQTEVTFNSTDTLDEIARKLNSAIAYGLDQAKYAIADADKFVNFVTDPTEGTVESVEGTFVIRSLIAGDNGTLNFAGDEDLIKALSLNVIQDEKENEFRVSVVDAHNGNTVASNVKVTGNMLLGVVHPNVDMEFDAMANIDVGYNSTSKTFSLKKETEVYETVLHLADNTTVFQIGANESEDMGIDIGDMGAKALGINSILVTDRESAARSITVIDTAINRVSKQRAKLGAYQNRLEHTINNLTVASTNLSAAESRIRDLDMAKEMMNFTKLNILMQAGNSMLAQANQLPQNVLSLLR